MSENVPKLCVGIPTHDRSALAVQALESIVPQLGAQDELIVASDGSPDTSDGVIREWLRVNCPRGRMLRLPHVGASSARNAVLAEADAPIVCYIDDDVVADPEWLAALRQRWMVAGADVGMIGGPIRPIWGAPRPPWLADYLLYVLAILDLGSEPKRLDQRTGAGYVWGANMSVQVDAIRAVGGFDVNRGPRLGAPLGRGEEEELQDRLASAGWKVWYEPSAGVHHQLSPERLSATAFRAYFRQRGMLAGESGASRSQAVADLVRGSARYVLQRVAGKADAENATFKVARAWAVLTTRRKAA